MLNTLKHLAKKHWLFIVIAALVYVYRAELVSVAFNVFNTAASAVGKAQDAVFGTADADANADARTSGSASTVAAPAGASVLQFPAPIKGLGQVPPGTIRDIVLRPGSWKDHKWANDLSRFDVN